MEASVCQRPPAFDVIRLFACRVCRHEDRTYLSQVHSVLTESKACVLKKWRTKQKSRPVSRFQTDLPSYSLSSSLDAMGPMLRSFCAGCNADAAGVSILKEVSDAVHGADKAITLSIGPRTRLLGCRASCRGCAFNATSNRRTVPLRWSVDLRGTGH